MTRRSRKKKISRRPKSPKAVQRVPLPPGAAKLRPEKAVLTSKEIFVAVPVETCFTILASQLEQPHQWDPLIIDVKPVSESRARIGATSHVTLNLGERKLDSLATICRYHPNRAISWVLTTKPKVREDWRLEVKSHGTLVGVTLAHEVEGWVIGRLIYKVMRRKRVEQDLDKMLIELKKAIESISRAQQQLTGGVKT